MPLLNKDKPTGLGVTRKKLKSGNMFKHHMILVVSKTISNITRHLKSGAAPLYHSLVTSLLLSRKGFNTS